MEKKDLTEVIICREEDTVLEVSRVLRDTRARHLVVLNTEDKPVGIISTVDVNNRIVAEEKDPKQIQAKDMMTKDLDTVDINDPFKKAFEKMIKRNTYSIPVTRDGKLIGLLEFTTCMRKLQENEQHN